METHALIRSLASDGTRPSRPLPQVWGAALPAAALAAALVFFSTIGPRPDFEAALATLRFPLKFVLTSILALSAFAVLSPLARPGGESASNLAWLLAAPLLLGAAVLLELAAVPPSEWASRLVGVNNLYCLGFIPLIGAGPLGLFLLALRHGAPTRPRLAGAVAGLLAGGLAASFYAAHCPDDSPLFVATWYTLAIALLAGLGAMLAPRLARW